MRSARFCSLLFFSFLEFTLIPIGPNANADSSSQTPGAPGDRYSRGSSVPSRPGETRKSPLLRFSGTLEAVDLNAHPMTATAINRRGDPFVFGGDLTPETTVLRGPKAVGVKGLTKGARILISYIRTPDGPHIMTIRILSRDLSHPARNSRLPGSGKIVGHELKKNQGSQ